MQTYKTKQSEETRNIDFLTEHYPENVYAVGFDSAIIGYDASSGQAIYSYDICIQILMKQGMSFDDAHEHMEYNVIGAKGIDHAPIFMHILEYDKSVRHKRV